MPRDTIDELLDFATDRVEPREEAEAILRADGVDVDGFLARLRARVKGQRDATRLAPLNSARYAISRQRTQRVDSRYAGMGREALWDEVRGRGLAGTHYHKLEELTDDDLRTWLEDADAIDEDT
jgi:hypothetical protein